MSQTKKYHCNNKGKIPKAVIPTDLYGQCVDLNRILEVCEPYGIPVIADSAEAMGAKYIIFVAKHVGGFCMWQTETTDYGVRNIPWRGGKGDVLGDLAESCRKRGMKLGVYLSPYDRKQGAGSGGRCRTKEAQQRYNTIYRRQLTEVLSRYGRMFEVWFDGSNVIPVGDILTKHAPRAMVFQGPHATIRWVGNEDGVAPYPAWNAVSGKDARSTARSLAFRRNRGETAMNAGLRAIKMLHSVARSGYQENPGF